MESRLGKLTVLAWLLVHHGQAVEADLFPDVDLLDLYDVDSPLTLRRVWVLVRNRLLIDRDGDLGYIAGTALARSIAGELGDWTRSDLMLAALVGAEPPESKATKDWKRSEQDRIKALRASRIEEAS